MKQRGKRNDRNAKSRVQLFRILQTVPRKIPKLTDNISDKITQDFQSVHATEVSAIITTAVIKPRM